MNNSPLVRTAGVEDAPAIAEIRVASWRATYEGLIPARILDGLDIARNESFVAGLIAEPPPRTTLVVEDGSGGVAGYAFAAPARDDDAAGLGEIEAIYLAPQCRGRGLGRPLLEEAANRLANAGFAPIVLWVLTANHAARRFYERAGFRADGAVRDLDFDGTPVQEIRYRRADSG